MSMTKPKVQLEKKLIVDVSIDFDFFIREDTMWDFGHSEGGIMASDFVWSNRYSSIDLHKETSPLKYADFEPEHIVTKLDALFGTTISPAKLAWANSHKHAHDFFKAAPSRADVVINIDAHHDGWAPNPDQTEASCQDWAVMLQRDWTDTQFIQVYPKWKDAEYDGPSAVKNALTFSCWDQFIKAFQPQLAARNLEVRNVFTCNSQSWVPPHHDKSFVTMVKKLMARSRHLVEIEKIRLRKTVTRKQAADMRKNTADNWAKLKELGFFEVLEKNPTSRVGPSAMKSLADVLESFSEDR